MGKEQLPYKGHVLYPPAFSPKATNDVFLGRSSDLLPLDLSSRHEPVTKAWVRVEWSLQQRELSGIYTRFPFNL
ncbi:MAG: hypothetical protein JWO58_1967 [Chitinophagaceae bacterium]|nr:hypothetical protein [Chitinophagaceae bacterium]